MDVGDGAGVERLSLAELSERAFARPDGGDSAGAEAALRELRRREELRRVEMVDAVQTAEAPILPGARAGAEVEVEVTTVEALSSGKDEGASIRSPRRRLAIVGVAAAGLVVGALAAGGFLATSSVPGTVVTATPTASVSEQPPSAYPLTLEQGDIGAAMDWFERAQTNNDWFPDPGTLTSFGIEAGSTRRIADFPPHTAIFVGKTTSGFCLLWATTDSSVPQSTLTCASEQVFARAGLLLQDGTSSYTWNGRTLTSSITPPFND